MKLRIIIFNLLFILSLFTNLSFGNRHDNGGTIYIIQGRTAITLVTELEGIASIQLVNSLGEIVFSEQVAMVASYELDTRPFRAATYTLHVCIYDDFFEFEVNLVH